tara:strand:+ start:1695 stop:2132 length:438 start_codon:yes stop_codon:yes gene_type:complete
MSSDTLTKSNIERITGLAASAGFVRSEPVAQETKRTGRRLLRFFHYDSSRYSVEDKICPSCDGWTAFSTDQDAWYYGVWVNRSLRSVVCYAEGDLIVTVATSKEDFNQEIDALREFHGEPPVSISVIDESGTLTRFRIERPDLYL